MHPAYICGHSIIWSFWYVHVQKSWRNSSNNTLEQEGIINSQKGKGREERERKTKQKGKKGRVGEQVNSYKNCQNKLQSNKIRGVGLTTNNKATKEHTPHKMSQMTSKSAHYKSWNMSYLRQDFCFICVLRLLFSRSSCRTNFVTGNCFEALLPALCWAVCDGVHCGVCDDPLPLVRLSLDGLLCCWDLNGPLVLVWCWGLLLLVWWSGLPPPTWCWGLGGLGCWYLDGSLQTVRLCWGLPWGLGPPLVFWLCCEVASFTVNWNSIPPVLTMDVTVDVLPCCRCCLENPPLLCCCCGSESPPWPPRGCFGFHVLPLSITVVWLLTIPLFSISRL